ncbi:MAG: phosphoethanolamine transferase [Weeksellaceae bacterium]|nr:phosphoethanolamine transferase [Weeksellaceae bacterium]
MKPTRYLPYLLFILSVIIYLTGFLFSYDYLVKDWQSGNRLDTARSVAEYAVMYASLLLFCALFRRYRYGCVVAYLLLIIVSVNSFISYCCYLVYHSGFNIGMAVSVLDSNIREAGNMIGYYLLPLFISLILLLVNILVVNMLSKIKWSWKLYMATALWFIMPAVFLLKQHWFGYKGGAPMVKNIIYHFKDLEGAYRLNKNMAKITDNKVAYHYQKEDQGTETIILVIGESVRKQNMSLYGYTRTTTPNEDAQQDQMILFSDAHSPGAITNLSIPLFLSPISPQDYSTHIEKVSDNVVNLANSQGYTTYWLTTQNNIKGVTEIATFSKHKKWVNGYDMSLMPFVADALKDKNKKFIVIHVTGSHPDPCLRYPESFRQFRDGSPMDCYDNSIFYTDHLLGELFKKLDGQNAALIYLSDHGLKYSDQKLIHADSKESTRVPFYVWFSNPNLKNHYRFDKNVDQPVSTSYLYPMVMKMLGLKEIKLDKVENDNFMKLDHKVINYKDLNP